MINVENFQKAAGAFRGNTPFDHCVIDDFFPYEIAQQIESEFLEYNSPHYHTYDNAIEFKKQNKDWGLFPKTTYQAFYYLNSNQFLDLLSEVVGVKLYSDPGLHGGGWHIHKSGGKLNPHLDYSLHPKIGLARKINLIIYVSENLKPENGGTLGLYSGTAIAPEKLVTTVEPKFNRAVMFDTTQNSWHGLVNPVVGGDDVYRKSLTVYYLTDPVAGVDPRSRALFSPTEDQKNDATVLDLIKSRAV